MGNRKLCFKMPLSLDGRKHGPRLFSCQVELFFPLWWFKGKGRRRSNKSWHLLFLSCSGKPHSISVVQWGSHCLKVATFRKYKVRLGWFYFDNPGIWNVYSFILDCTISYSGLNIPKQLSTIIFSSFLFPSWFFVCLPLPPMFWPASLKKKKTKNNFYSNMCRGREETMINPHIPITSFNNWQRFVNFLTHPCLPRGFRSES